MIMHFYDEIWIRSGFSLCNLFHDCIEYMLQDALFSFLKILPSHVSYISKSVNETQAVRLGSMFKDIYKGSSSKRKD